MSWGDRGNFNKGVLATHGLDVRDPTADRRVLEYCLAIPPEQFILGGVPRSLARRAFADRLPAAVLVVLLALTVPHAAVVARLRRRAGPTPDRRCRGRQGSVCPANPRCS